MTRKVKHLLGGAVVLGAASLAAPSMAAAATPTWNCSSSAVQVKLLSGSAINPVNANTGSPVCTTQHAGVQSLSTATGGVLGGGAATADTDATTNTASSSVTGLTVPGNNPPPLLTVRGTISSSVTGTCMRGVPQFADTYSTTTIQLGSQTIVADHPVTVTLTGLTGNLAKLAGAVATITPGEIVKTATSETVTGLHVTVIQSNTTVLDVKAAQSTVSLLSTCPSTTGAGSSGPSTTTVNGVTVTTNGNTASATAKAPASPTGATPVDYTWNWGDGSATQDTGANSGATHTYSKPGTYTLTTTIRYSDGSTQVSSRTITVGAAQAATYTLPFTVGRFHTGGLQGWVDLKRRTSNWMNANHAVQGFIKAWIPGRTSYVKRKFKLTVLVNGKKVATGTAVDKNNTTVVYTVHVPKSVTFTKGTRVTVVGAYAPNHVKRTTSNRLR